jgi:hypothetical protein
VHGGWWSAPTGTQLSLRRGDGPAPLEGLRNGLGDRNSDGGTAFGLYDYGPGDGVEVINWARLSRKADGSWQGAMAPGVRRLGGARQ